MAVTSLTNASNAAAPIAEVPVASKENASPPADEISEPAPTEASTPVTRQSAPAPSQVDRAPSRATPAHHPTATVHPESALRRATGTACAHALQTCGIKDPSALSGGSG